MLKRRENDGFSLVEVLLSAAIMAGVLAALLRVFAEMVQLDKTGRDLTSVASHAQYVLEDIRASSGVLINQIDSGQWNLDSDEDFAAVGLSRLKEETIAVTHDSTAPLTITVTIHWQMDNGRPLQQVFYTVDAGI